MQADGGTPEPRWWHAHTARSIHSFSLAAWPSVPLPTTAATTTTLVHHHHPAVVGRCRRAGREEVSAGGGPRPLPSSPPPPPPPPRTSRPPLDPTPPPTPPTPLPSPAPLPTLRRLWSGGRADASPTSCYGSGSSTSVNAGGAERRGRYALADDIWRTKHLQMTYGLDENRMRRHAGIDRGESGWDLEDYFRKSRLCRRRWRRASLLGLFQDGGWSTACRPSAASGWLSRKN